MKEKRVWVARCDTIPGVGKNGQSKDNDVPPEVFTRLHVPEVEDETRSQQQKKKKNTFTRNIQTNCDKMKRVRNGELT